MKPKTKIAFFGGEPLGVPVLRKLYQAGITPNLIVCSPDRKAGRGLSVTKPPVKEWAEKHDVEVFQPESYKDESVRQKLAETEWDLFVVVAYNFILPKWLLEIPIRGSLNVHPSLLPELRGPSPIRTAILENNPDAIGVTVMLLDEKMDTGPILEQEAYLPEQWPIEGTELDEKLADIGGSLLAEVIPAWLDDALSPQEQDHDSATYTKVFNKGENELDLDPLHLPKGDDAVAILSKIYAWQGIGDTFFMHGEKRVKVKTASLSEDGLLDIETVVPEGKKEMTFQSFLQSLSSK